jgi:integrase
VSRATKRAPEPEPVIPVAGLKALAAAGLDPKHRFHDLRHTFGTRMAAAGVPMRTLQEWMGHADFATTLIYADYQPGAHEAELVAAAFAREAPGAAIYDGEKLGTSPGT